jgi:hypothetical protein
MSCLSPAGASRLTPTSVHKNLQSDSKKVTNYDADRLSTTIKASFSLANSASFDLV